MQKCNFNSLYLNSDFWAPVSADSRKHGIFPVKSGSVTSPLKLGLFCTRNKWDLGFSLPLPFYWSGESHCTDVHVVHLWLPRGASWLGFWERSSTFASLTEVPQLILTHWVSEESKACGSGLAWPHLGAPWGCSNTSSTCSLSEPFIHNPAMMLPLHNVPKGMLILCFSELQEHF